VKTSDAEKVLTEALAALPGVPEKIEGICTTLMVLLDRLTSQTVELQELRLAFHQKFGPYTPSAYLDQVEEN